MNTQPHLVGGRSNWAPLSENGKRQADLLGEYWRQSGMLPEVVYSSPALRSRQTIERVLKHIGLNKPPEIDGRLQELSQGDFEGSARDEVYTPDVIEAIYTQQKSFKLPGGESIDETGERMFDWLTYTAEAHHDSVVLAGTHGFAIRCLIGKLHGWSQSQILAAETDNASLTRIDATFHEFTVLTVGENVIPA